MRSPSKPKVIPSTYKNRQLHPVCIKRNKNGPQVDRNSSNDLPSISKLNPGAKEKQRSPESVFHPRRHPGCTQEVPGTQEAIRSHAGGRHSGDTQEAPRSHSGTRGRQPGGTQPRRHPGDTKAAPRRRPGRNQEAPRTHPGDTHLRFSPLA